MSTNIESHLTENRSFEPAKSFSRTAHIQRLEEYQELYRKSIEKPEEFWAEQAAELLVWQKNWKTVLEWKKPFVRWFVGGKLNVSENCLDRHLKGATKDKVALIWEGEPGENPSPELREKLRRHVGMVIGPIAKPDDVRFAEALPKTRSGKIMRRLLKEIAGGGQVTGDTTTLEDFSVLVRLRNSEE